MPPTAPQPLPHHQEDVPFIRFRTDKARDRYRVIQHLRFVKERKFENDFEEFPEVNHQLVTRRWQLFNNLLGEGNENLAREFYAHAHRPKKSDPSTFACVVCSVNIDYSRNAWNSFLELPEVEHCVV
jgi:hypothetical protein